MAKNVRKLSVLVEAKTKGFVASILGAIRKSQDLKRVISGMHKAVRGAGQIIRGTGKAAVAGAMGLMRMKGAASMASSANRDLASGCAGLKGGLKKVASASQGLVETILKSAWAAIKAKLSFHGLAKGAKKMGEGMRSLVRLTRMNLIVNLLSRLAAKLREVVGYYGALAEGMQSTAEAADRVGMSVRQFSGTQFAASLSGISGTQFQANMGNMMQHIGMLASGARTVGIHLKLFGLNAKKLAGMSVSRDLAAIASAMRKVHNAAQRAALAQAFFGRSGQKMISFLMQGNAQIQRQVRLAKNLGVAFNSVQADRVERANVALKEMSAVWTGIQQRLVVGLAPAVAALGKWFLKVSDNGKIMGKIMNTVLAFVAGGVGLVVDLVVDGKELMVAAWKAVEAGILDVASAALTAAMAMRKFYFGVGKWMVSKVTGVSVKRMDAEEAHPGGGKAWQRLRALRNNLRSSAESKAFGAMARFAALRADPWKHSREYAEKMDLLLAASQDAPRRASKAIKILTLPVKVKRAVHHTLKHRARHHLAKQGKDAALSVLSRAQIPQMDAAERRAIAQRDQMIQIMSLVAQGVSALQHVAEASL